MIWLAACPGMILAALVAVRWLGTQMRLIWRAQRQQPAWTLMATVIRPLPAGRPPLPGPRVVRGEVTSSKDERVLRDSSRW